ncbi:MAG: nucleoside 2-deoxyribosyltransferase [Thermoanaerobaculaceae bacterium]
MKSGGRRRLYLAGPLFSDAERAFNRIVRDALKPFFEVYLPQEDGGLAAEMLEDGMPRHRAMRTVFLRDMTAMENCDVVVAILDGRAIDEGTAFELGFCCARGKRCIGLQTDARRIFAAGNNAMIEGALEALHTSLESLVAWAQTAYNLRSQSPSVFEPGSPTTGNKVAGGPINAASEMGESTVTTRRTPS